MKSSSAEKFFMLVVIAFVCPTLFGQDEDLRGRFTEAYRSYQTAAGSQNWNEALPFAVQAFTLGQELYGVGNANAVALRYNYGLNLFYVRQFDASIEQLEQAAQDFGLLGDAGVDQLLSVRMDLGRVHATAGYAIAARRAFRDAMTMLDELFGKDSVQYANISLQAGRMMVDILGASEAREFLEDSHDYFLEELGASDPSTALAAFYLGKHWAGQDEHRRAAPLLEAAVPVFRDQPEQRNNMIAALTLLIQGYQQTNRADAATPHLLALARIAAQEQGGNVEPQPIFTARPEYPTRNDFRNIRSIVASTAVVRFDLDAAGVVQNARLDSNTGAEAYAPAALEAIEQFRYVPRVINGEPVASSGMSHEFNFQPSMPTLPR